MDKHRIRHLPVVDGAKVIGMLSIRDVMAWRLRDSRDEVSVLRETMIATRHHPKSMRRFAGCPLAGEGFEERTSRIRVIMPSKAIVRRLEVGCE